MNERLARLRQAREDASGFTLIELLIVIVILAVLAGIVVFAVAGVNDDSKKSACKADLKNVEIASETYYAQKRNYADAIDNAGHTATTLVGAKLLREAPSTTNGYTISYNSADGSVSSTGC